MTWRSALAGAIVCTVIGLGFLWFGNGLVLWGYDLIFFLKLAAFPTQPPQDVVMVYMTDDSFRKLNQVSVVNWDRNYHAQLVDKLTAAQARAVVFDILFRTPDPVADAEFARAIRRNGRVVLAGSREEGGRQQILTRSFVPPTDVLREAAAGWGVAALYQPWSDGTVARQYYVGDSFFPSLSWVAAGVAGAAITREPNARQPDTYLNYYGPALTLPWISYADALEEAPGYFRGKIVFVGYMPKTQGPLETVDSFAGPLSLFKGAKYPGAEIGATAFLNLWRGDGMREMGLEGRVSLVLLAGGLFGAGLARCRPRWAAGLAAAGCLVMVILATELAKRQVWFPWTIPALVQIPLALAWSVGGQYVRLRFETDVLTRTLEETTRLVEATKLTAHKPAQLVPDHDMVRLVGRGAYGEVWLARNAIGAFHAVKIVRRAGFPSDVPYEREFRGIQKFMPISRSHVGFVHVLHVGRNETERCFYCIMEAGDDQTTGQRIDPETYTPKTLASELKWRGRLSPEETLKLGLALSLALDHLHQSKLIHRDIKPGNIIYVNQQPKFADIGLVTDMAGEGKDVSFLGTQGYLPPEGPGSPGADVYALGKVLYEAVMGRDREFFPEVPTAVYEEAEHSLWRQMQRVIFRACEASASDRYRSAGELHAALNDLARGLSHDQTRAH